MDTIRISASDIDALRYYRADDDASLEDLIAQLRHERPASEAMEAGTALHHALEHIAPGEHRELHAKGFTFDLDFDAAIDIPPIRELKATKDYIVKNVLVTLVGKVDGVHGKRVDDHKLTGHHDAERFFGGFQWRIYLDIFDADEFRWNVFEGREVAPKIYKLFGFHRLAMYRYPDMKADVLREIGRFVEFARDHLPERIVPQNPLAGG